VSNWLGENEEGNFLLNEELLQEAVEIWPNENGEASFAIEDIKSRTGAPQ
jgi:hypothetical protein